MIRLLCSVVLLFCWVAQAQQKWVLDTENSFITYEASHFLHDWSGTNQNVKGLMIEDQGVFQKVAIAMYVRDFDSKNSNRDNNALEILEVLQFPKIEFFSDQIEKKVNDVIFIGRLNFHGIELTKDFLVQSKLNSNQFVLEGSFDLTLSDFKVPLPSFMFRKMEDKVSVKYQLYFNKLER
jgi:polyisoprenoid-binding protein YceI